MAALSCPSCAAAIPSDDVKVAEGVAFCRACGSQLCAGSALQGAESAFQHILDEEPPDGCWLNDDGAEVRIGVIARTAKHAAFFGLFALGWNTGIIFLGTKPVMDVWRAWFQPSGAPWPIVSTYVTVLLVPFVIAGLVLSALALVALAGNIEVRVRGDSGEVFVGVGAIGWRRTFDPARITAIELVDIEGECGVIQAVRIQADRPITLASLVSPLRSQWLARTLTAALKDR